VWNRGGMPPGEAKKAADHGLAQSWGVKVQKTTEKKKTICFGEDIGIAALSQKGMFYDTERGREKKRNAKEKGGRKKMEQIKFRRRKKSKAWHSETRHKRHEDRRREKITKN